MITIDVDSVGYLLHYPTYSENSPPPPINVNYKLWKKKKPVATVEKVC